MDCSVPPYITLHHAELQNPPPKLFKGHTIPEGPYTLAMELGPQKKPSPSNSIMVVYVGPSGNIGFRVSRSSVLGLGEIGRVVVPNRLRNLNPTQPKPL